MNDADRRTAVIAHWWMQADEALQAARLSLAHGLLLTAVNRAYYACFHAASAAFLAEGRDFEKHTALQAAVHRDLIHTGRLEPEWGRLYNALLEARHRGDYQPLAEFSVDQVQAWVEGAAGFVRRLRELSEPAPE